MVRLFVYGTLMRGERAHALLDGARFRAEVATAPGFALLDLGAYPGMVRVGAASVLGELYEVPQTMLPRLDAYEGCPELFERVEIGLEDGERAAAYLLRAAFESTRPWIPGGNWRARRR